MKKAVPIFVAVSMMANLLNSHEGCSQPVIGNIDNNEREYREISTLELNQLIYTSRSSFVIIDARLAEEDDGRRIADAKFLPADTGEKIIRVVIPNQKARLIVYGTHLDCPNSAKMACRLVKMGYSHVFQYREGIEGWEKSGNRVERVRKAAMRPPQVKPLIMD